MDDENRLRALEDRVLSIEHRLGRLENDTPFNLTEEVFDGAQRFAFLLLLTHLETRLPTFSVTRFREEFLRMQIEIWGRTFESQPNGDFFRECIEKDLRSLAEELIPPSIHDTPRP